MALDLCWFTNASISLSSSCRNLERTCSCVPWAWLSTGHSATHCPLEPPEPRPSEGPYLSDCTDKGTSAFSLQIGAIMAGLVEEQSPGVRPRALG